MVGGWGTPSKDDDDGDDDTRSNVVVVVDDAVVCSSRTSSISAGKTPVRRQFSSRDFPADQQQLVASQRVPKRTAQGPPDFS